jgi:hypothetical protein
MSDGDIAVVRAAYTTDLSRLDTVFRGFCYESVPIASAPTLSGVPFEVRNASDALAAPDALPTASLLVDGVDSGASVTVALVSMGRYTATVGTMPILTAGEYLTLRARWQLKGLDCAVDMFRDFYWVPTAPATEPLSRFDTAISTLTWPQYEHDFSVDVIFTSVAGTAYAAKAIRRLHERNRVQRELSQNTESECVWQLNTELYPVPTEEGALITHGTNRWIVTGCRQRGYIRDFFVRNVQAVNYGDDDSILWSARAPGDWGAISFNR